jgi:polyhydroxyalkanoate synthesis repressor PhaR
VAILIKRYANRKLYNTETSRYITLKGVGELLDRGEEVRVVDNETGEDITQVALSQILVDNKRAREVPSDTLLTQILSRGGDAVYSAIRKSVDEASDGLGEFQERFRQLVHRRDVRGDVRGDRGGDTAMARGRGFAWDLRGREEPEHEPASPGVDPRAGSRPDFRTNEWPSRAEIDRLNRNLERVAGALERLEKTLAQPRTRS